MWKNIAKVNYEYNEVNDSLSTYNICLVTYTIAQVRLKLFSYPEQLGDRILYYDTDSIIYISLEKTNQIFLQEIL